MKKYFGTDGIRGIYKEDLTEDLAFKIGFALGTYFFGECIVAYDSRPSSLPISNALIDGLLSAGIDVKNAFILPTPAVSSLTKSLFFDFGIMITASHNDVRFNGIKVFNSNGSKLSSSQERQIERLINNPPFYSVKKGNLSELREGKDAYINRLKENNVDLSGLRVLLDGANGAVGNIAKQIFTHFNASVDSINDEYNGQFINENCGSLYASKYVDLDYDFVFAFDGDGDRVSCIYKNQVIDGDSILYSLSRANKLKDNVVVSTIMSNSALEKALELDKKRLIKTDVGDKNVSDIMIKNGYNLGGESSGHFIFYPYCLTGDAIKASINLCTNSIYKLDLIPQKTISLDSKRSILDDSKFIDLKNTYESRLDKLLIRMSGTEPKIRITIEDKNESLIDKALNDFTDLIGEVK